MTKKTEKNPSTMTVEELLKTLGVPLHVQIWLDRFARGERVLEEFGCHDDPGVNETAFLIYDTLEAQYDGETVRESSEEARDFVEEWLYTLSNFYDVQVWNNADAAVAVLPWFISSEGAAARPEGDAAFVLLRTAIERLTTKSERRAFLRRDAEQEPDREEETNQLAAFKLSRVLADPRTDKETRRELEYALSEFANAADVQVTHPALARRAFQLMCEARPKGKVRELARLRGALLGLLDSIAEEKGGDE